MGQMIQVETSDNRGGHDGAANGGSFGGYTMLLVKPAAGVPIEEAVFVVSHRDDSTFRSGRLSYSERDITTVLAVDPEKVEWACLLKGVDRQPALGRSDTRRYEAVAGLPGGPLVKLQKFLEEYPAWVNENIGPATVWLENTMFQLGKEDVLEAIRYAQGKSAKNKVSSAWEDVAKMLGVEVQWKYSWTGVRSAPLKIALAVQKLYKEAWDLKGAKAFSYSGHRPFHPGNAGSYLSLPSYEVELREAMAE